MCECGWLVLDDAKCKKPRTMARLEIDTDLPAGKVGIVVNETNLPTVRLFFWRRTGYPESKKASN